MAKKNFRTCPKPSKKGSCRGPSAHHSEIFVSQWCCWSCKQTSMSVSTESTDQSIWAPNTSKAVWRQTIIITGRMFPQTSFMFCWCSVDVRRHIRPHLYSRGSLSPMHWSWKMQLRHTCEWKNLMGPEMTRIILSSVADRSDYGLCEERTVGLSGLKGIRWGVMNAINAIYLQNKG